MFKEKKILLSKKEYKRRIFLSDFLNYFGYKHKDKYQEMWEYLDSLLYLERKSNEHNT